MKKRVRSKARGEHPGEMAITLGATVRGHALPIAIVLAVVATLALAFSVPGDPGDDGRAQRAGSVML